MWSAEFFFYALIYIKRVQETKKIAGVRNFLKKSFTKTPKNTKPRLLNVGVQQVVKYNSKRHENNYY
jgi:hypothetical protein